MYFVLYTLILLIPTSLFMFCEFFWYTAFIWTCLCAYMWHIFGCIYMTHSSHVVNLLVCIHMHLCLSRARPGASASFGIVCAGVLHMPEFVTYIYINVTHSCNLLNRSIAKLQFLQQSTRLGLVTLPFIIRKVF